MSTIRALKEGRAALEESVRRRTEQEKARMSESKTAEGERRKLHDDYATRLEALREERDVARGAVERLEKEAIERVRAADNAALELEATRDAVRETANYAEALESELKVMAAERDALRDANEDARARIEFLKAESESSASAAAAAAMARLGAEAEQAKREARETK